MRCAEIITEELIKSGGYEIWISPGHFWRQAEARGVKPAVVNTMLKRISRGRHAIDKMEPHEQFNLYDEETGTHLGMMRSGTTPNKLLLNTTYIDHNFRGRNPLVKVR